MSNKKLSFNVTLEFESKIVDDQTIVDIAKNIAFAIKHEADTRGITPDYADTYTTKVSVTPQYLPNETIKMDIV